MWRLLVLADWLTQHRLDWLCDRAWSAQIIHDAEPLSVSPMAALYGGRSTPRDQELPQ